MIITTVLSPQPKAMSPRLVKRGHDIVDCQPHVGDLLTAKVDPTNGTVG